MIVFVVDVPFWWSVGVYSDFWRVDGESSEDIWIILPRVFNAADSENLNFEQ